MKKLRVLGFSVQAHLVIDEDGEELIPVQTEPVQVGNRQWPQIVELMEKARVDLEKTLVSQQVDDADLSVSP